MHVKEPEETHGLAAPLRSLATSEQQQRQSRERSGWCWRSSVFGFHLGGSESVYIVLVYTAPSTEFTVRGRFRGAWLHGNGMRLEKLDEEGSPVDEVEQATTLRVVNAGGEEGAFQLILLY